MAQLGGRRCAGDVQDLLGHILTGKGIKLDPLSATTVFELSKTRARGARARAHPSGT